MGAQALAHKVEATKLLKTWSERTAEGRRCARELIDTLTADQDVPKFIAAARACIAEIKDCDGRMTGFMTEFSVVVLR